MNSVNIKYQTAEVIPPPFAHAIAVKLTPTPNDLALTFELNYLDRQSLSIEDIEEEGFSENDDFVWEGSLPKIWADIIIGNIMASKTLKINNLTEIQSFWEIQTDEKTFYPKNTEEWQYLLEELRQAVFEKAGKELPMKLVFLKIDAQHNRQYELEASFVNRELRIINDSQTKLLAWNDLNYYLKNIFSADFYPEIATTQLPNTAGRYLNTGDEYWYEFGKSLKGNYKAIEQIFMA